MIGQLQAQRRPCQRRIRHGQNAGQPVKHIDQLIDALDRLKRVAIRLKSSGQEAFEAHALIGDDCFIKINASAQTAELVSSGKARRVRGEDGFLRGYYDFDGVMVTWLEAESMSARKEAA